MSGSDSLLRGVRSFKLKVWQPWRPQTALAQECCHAQEAEDEGRQDLFCQYRLLLGTARPVRVQAGERPAEVLSVGRIDEATKAGIRSPALLLPNATELLWSAYGHIACLGSCLGPAWRSTLRLGSLTAWSKRLTLSQAPAGVARTGADSGTGGALPAGAATCDELEMPWRSASLLLPLPCWACMLRDERGARPSASLPTAAESSRTWLFA